MGKIRVAKLGDETTQQAQKERARVKREQKKIREIGKVEEEKASKVSRVSQVPRATKKTESKQPTTDNRKPARNASASVAGGPTADRRLPKTARGKKMRSKAYKQALAFIDRKKFYAPIEAIELVKKTATTKFVATIEAHFNLNKKISAKNSASLTVEKKAPLGHGKVGKVNEKTVDLEKNLNELIKTVGATSITKLILSSTMGPGVKVEVKK